MPKIRLLLADDHAVLRAGLRMLLDAQPDMQVVAEAGDAETAIARARATAPEVALLDVSMPGPGPVQSIKRLLRVKPDLRIVMLTMHDDRAYVRAALLAGAVGYVVKQVADSELLVAIRAVHEGRMFVDSGRPDDPEPPSAAPKTKARLTAREAEVLRLLAQGYTNREAARELRVSEKTVETHRARLGSKLKLRTRAELYRFAVESGLLSEQPVKS